MNFSNDLYCEHLEEGAFLFDQRSELCTDPELGWDDLADFEERLDAHADALVVGGELALEVCCERAVVGDPGELHMAARVFCRQDRFDLLSECLKDFNASDSEPIIAVRNALNHELPLNWIPQVEALLIEGTELSLAVFAKVIGHRRFKLVRTLTGALKHCSESILHNIIWSLGRIRGHEAHSDELFEDEREGAEKGNAINGDGKLTGTTVEMLIKRPDIWRQWWKANGTRFKTDICYRQGQPYTPQGLLEILKNPKSPRMLRQIAYEELVIRYGLDVAFETDMTVREQKAALARYEKLIAQRTRIQTGLLVFWRPDEFLVRLCVITMPYMVSCSNDSHSKLYSWPY